MVESIQSLWRRADFKPSRQQRAAILHTNGPLFLTAGPGSGKTRVLIWRTLNLIVFKKVPPEEIFLGTFTEKAALQLRQGLTAYVTDASRSTGRAYDLSRMAIGTVHSICRRILSDRRFSRGRMRPGYIGLVDDLDQYFAVLGNWDDLVTAGGFDGHANESISAYITGRGSGSRHGAVSAALSLFNRFSEECLDPKQALRRTRDATLKRLIRMYGAYQKLEVTDLALLQKAALDHCRDNEGSSSVFRHVIVDEYQDTNYVQEAIFFHLASGHRNLCVVGDDDQALYRFRGSTVENLVEFENRCHRHLGCAPKPINLGKNYRSRRTIVQFYSDFIQHPHFDWRKPEGNGAYRIQTKEITPHSSDGRPAVVASAPGHPDDVCDEVAELVRRLLDQGKVSDPNEIAFLYPSLKSPQVKRMIASLERNGLKVYAPRAGQFLNVPEALDIFGILLVLFGNPADDPGSPGMTKYFEWMKCAHARGKQIVRKDRTLAAFIKERQQQIKRAIADRKRLLDALEPIDLDDDLDEAARKQLLSVKKLSPRAANYLRRSLPSLIERRRLAGRPLTVGNVVNRLTTLDWGVLDVFYEFTGFGHFRSAFRVAARGDEAPLYNLSMVSKYIARFQTRHGAVLSAYFLDESKFKRTFFNSFIYALWRRGESEYEDAEDPFPKGRLPFLTIHQAKGLEFPVVVLGNPRKRATVPKIEEIVRPLLGERQGEPLDRIGTFDVARMFYVALSRPENLLVLCHYQGRGQFISEPFRSMLCNGFPRIADLKMATIPKAEPEHEEELPKAYSYTGDYLAYRACPQRYAFYRHYDFAPTRAQTMVFGSLVHRTIEDLHEWLRAQAEAGRYVP